MSTTPPPTTPPQTSTQQTTSPPRASTSRPLDLEPRVSPWAAGFALFAGVVMVVTGMNQVFIGIAGIVGDELYVALDDYVYDLDLTAWGWIHLGFGVLLLVTGFAVVRGKDWARAVAIVLASLSLIANFLFVPYYPVWALLVIALDIAVIWALTVTWGREGY